MIDKDKKEQLLEVYPHLNADINKLNEIAVSVDVRRKR